jgi:hypothetical protein
MKISELKNYGKSLSEMAGSMPDEEKKKLNALSLKVLKKHLGLFNLLRFMVLAAAERRRMSKRDLLRIREQGLTDETFIKSQVRFAALFSALSKIVGSEKALEIFYEMMEVIAPQSFTSLLPTPEDYERCGDSWTAWREYFLAMAEADKKAGCHVYKVVEDSDDVLQMNCTYCAWYEIPKQLGVAVACLPSCYADEVYFPDALQFHRLCGPYISS